MRVYSSSSVETHTRFPLSLQNRTQLSLSSSPPLLAGAPKKTQTKKQEPVRGAWRGAERSADKNLAGAPERAALSLFRAACIIIIIS
jgi:hypothetical protein